MTAGLGARRVKAIAAAKHHTVAATEGGEVFTWGSNRGTSWCKFQLSSLEHRSDDWFHLFFWDPPVIVQYLLVADTLLVHIDA